MHHWRHEAGQRDIRTVAPTCVIWAETGWSSTAAARASRQHA